MAAFLAFCQRHSPLLPIALAVLLTLPALTTGLQLDDYYHWALVNQIPWLPAAQDLGGWYGLFTFLDGNPERTRALMEQGMVPWWTLPEVQYAFWRPVSELTHIVDYALWPRLPVLMHLHSLVYFVLVLWLAYHLFPKLLPTSGAALLAFWVFALSYSHGLPAGWLANRNALLATLFVLLTLHAHLAWRQHNQLQGLVWALLFFALGLLSGELAVSAGLLLFAFALCLDRGTWLARFISLVPYMLLGVVWLGVRAALGYGARGSGHYIDPTDFGAAITTISGRFVDLLVGQLLVLPPEFMSALPGRHPVLLGLLIVILLAFVPMLRRFAEARFWLVGAVLCVVPVCATLPHSRLLFCVSVATSALLGLFLTQRRALFAQRPALRRLVTPLAALFYGTALVTSPLLLPVEAVSMKLAMNGLLNRAAFALPIENAADVTQPEQKPLHLLINPPLSSVAGYLNGVRLYHGLPVVPRLLPLVSGSQTLRVTPVADNRLQIEAPAGVFQAGQEGLLRALGQHPFVAGDRIELPSLQATVLAVDDRGMPVGVEFQVAESLYSNHVVLWHWRAGKPAACELPPIGESVLLESRSEHCATP